MDDRQLELPLDVPLISEGARPILQQLDESVELGDYHSTIAALQLFNRYVWKTFSRSLHTEPDYI